MALEQEGCQVVFSNDISQKKQAIYAENFDASNFVCSDIRELCGKDIPDVEIATASFPCTDLSLAGNRAGLAGADSSTLLEFLRILGEMGDRKPPVVMLENVVGFVTSNQGNDLHLAVNKLNLLGYQCDLLLLDAKWFVPQSRQRVFLMGSRETNQFDSKIHEDISHPPVLSNFIRSHPQLNWCHFKLPNPAKRQVNLDSIVEMFDSSDSIWWDESRLISFVDSLRPTQAMRLEGLRHSSQIIFATAYRRTRHGNATWEIRPDDISGCLRTNGGGSSKQALVEAGNGNVRVRWMTAREYARLQGAPFFKFESATESQAKFAFGDGVCVPAVAWLTRHCIVPQSNRLTNFIGIDSIRKSLSPMLA